MIIIIFVQSLIVDWLCKSTHIFHKFEIVIIVVFLHLLKVKNCQGGGVVRSFSEHVLHRLNIPPYQFNVSLYCFMFLFTMYNYVLLSSFVCMTKYTKKYINYFCSCLMLSQEIFDVWQWVYLPPCVYCYCVHFQIVVTKHFLEILNLSHIFFLQYFNKN